MGLANSRRIPGGVCRAGDGTHASTSQCQQIEVLHCPGLPGTPSVCSGYDVMIALFLLFALEENNLVN